MKVSFNNNLYSAYLHKTMVASIRSSLLLAVIAAASTSCFLSYPSSATAFTASPRSIVPSSTKTRSSTKLFGLFDFIKDGKQQLVKSLAGDYDEAVIKARLADAIKSSPLLMLTFET